MHLGKREVLSMNNVHLVIVLIVLFCGISAHGATPGLNCGIAKRRNMRKIKGVTVAHPYPWLVGIIQAPWTSKTAHTVMCLGSVISRRDVLTAAHCVTKKLWPVSVVKDMDKLFCDSNDELEVSESFTHPMYLSKKPWYDFAVLRLTKQVDIMPVCLPSSNDPLTKYGIATVFNKTTCSQQDIVMPTFKTLECIRMLTRNAYFFEQTVRTLEAGFCAGYLHGPEDTCQGDSGGPFQAPTVKTHRYTILGVTSFGFGCRLENTLGVYGDVRDVVWWIRKVATAKTFVRGE
ncbi:trypsin 3A1-like [Hermetia illucens]|uniref:trypsin 3A1-like n=1 Tax=Hermetia illucens TaxID=343691 RepID=UPI0018CC3C6C|nr:trypsin 3A1-like [Hermetia illucens]